MIHRLKQWLIRLIDSLSVPCPPHVADWTTDEQTDYYALLLAEWDCGDGLA